MRPRPPPLQGHYVRDVPALFKGVDDGLDFFIYRRFAGGRLGVLLEAVEWFHPFGAHSDHADHHAAQLWLAVSRHENAAIGNRLRGVDRHWRSRCFHGGHHGAG